MDFLKYEFMSSPDGSYNKNLGELVKKIRYYTSRVPAEEFRAALPSLKGMELELQKFDSDINKVRINYIEKIMDELQEESEMEDKLFTEIERSCKTIASHHNIGLLTSDFMFYLKIVDAVYWLEFYGYKEKKEPDIILLFAKEIFRSVSYKIGILFIDIS